MTLFASTWFHSSRREQDSEFAVDIIFKEFSLKMFSLDEYFKFNLKFCVFDAIDR